MDLSLPASKQKLIVRLLICPIVGEDSDGVGQLRATSGPHDRAAAAGHRKERPQILSFVSLLIKGEV